jgi:hypothetical protein
MELLDNGKDEQSEYPRPLVGHGEGTLGNKVSKSEPGVGFAQ